MTESPGSALCVALAILAAVTLCVSGTTLLVGRALRQRSAPTREVNLRMGLCLVAVWPLLVLVGGIVAPWAQGLQSGAGVAVDSITQKEGAASVELLEVVSPSVGAARAKTNELQSTIERADLPTFIPSEPVPSVAAATPPASEPESRGLVPSPVPVQSQSVTAIETRLQAPVAVASSAPHPTPTPTAASPRTIPVPALWGFCGLSLLWMAGTLVAGFSLIRDLLRVRRMQRELQLCENDSIQATLTEAMQATGLRRRPEVCLSSLIGSPCTSGAWRPILILPQTMLDHREQDSATLLGVLTHECAHIVRRDVAWSLLARVVQSVYWWEPGLRRIVRQLSHLREEICDNHVLSSSIDARLYAKALVDFAAGPLFRPLVGVIGMVGKDNPLADRVERLLQESPDTTTRLGWQSKWGVATIVVLVCGVIGVIGAQAEISSAISRVLSPAFDKSPSRDPIASATVAESRAVPIWSGESPSSPATQSFEPALAQAAAAAEDPFSQKGIPTEAGSGVSLPVQSFSPFSEPTEAGSGVSAAPLYDDAPLKPPADEPVTQSPFSDATETGSSPHQRPSPPVTEYKPVISTLVVDGKPVTVTRMVPVFKPANAASDSEQPLLEEKADPGLHDLNVPYPKIVLELLDAPAFPIGGRVTVVATLPEGESLLPKRIRFEGLTVAGYESAPPPLNLLPDPAVPPPAAVTVPPATPSVPAETPPVEAATTEAPAAPAPEKAAPFKKHTILLSGPQSTIDALTSLKTKAVLTVVTKDDKPAIEPVPDQGSAAAALPEPALVFRMSLEALADDAGQYKGLRCWGRDLPHTAPDKGLRELGEILKNWKAELMGAAQDSDTLAVIRREPYSVRDGSTTRTEWRLVTQQISRADFMTLCSVELHVFDNMRYGDVQTILKVCEAQQLKVKIVSGSGDVPVAAQPQVYTTAELALVYDKKGQRVGDRAVLLAEKAGVSGMQVISSDDQINACLHNFVHHHRNSTPTLLLKADPDLSFETLQSFIILANRAGIPHVEFMPREELQLRANDQLVPLLNETPRPVAEPTREKLDGEYQLNRAEPTIDQSLPEFEEPQSRSRSFAPAGEITSEFEPALPRKPGRVRWDPQPIPSESLVREH